MDTSTTAPSSRRLIIDHRPEMVASTTTTTTTTNDKNATTTMTTDETMNFWTSFSDSLFAPSSAVDGRRHNNNNNNDETNEFNDTNEQQQQSPSSPTNTRGGSLHRNNRSNNQFDYCKRSRCNNDDRDYVYSQIDGSVLVDKNGIPITVTRMLGTKPLRNELLTRPGPGGKKLTYLSGESVTRTLNDIFGYDGWDLRIIRTEKTVCEQQSGGKWCVAYVAHVRITHSKSGTYKEDIGAGDAIDKNLPTAIQHALKASITDSMKRTARHFGDKLGNILYQGNFSLNSAPKTFVEALDQFDKERTSYYCCTGSSNTSYPANNSNNNNNNTGRVVLPSANTSRQSTAPAQNRNTIGIKQECDNKENIKGLQNQNGNQIPSKNPPNNVQNTLSIKTTNNNIPSQNQQHLHPNLVTNNDLKNSYSKVATGARQSTTNQENSISRVDHNHKLVPQQHHHQPQQQRTLSTRDLNVVDSIRQVNCVQSRQPPPASLDDSPNAVSIITESTGSSSSWLSELSRPVTSTGRTSTGSAASMASFVGFFSYPDIATPLIHDGGTITTSTTSNERKRPVPVTEQTKVSLYSNNNNIANEANIVSKKPNVNPYSNQNKSATIA